MADTTRNSAAAPTGVVGGLPSDQHLLGDDLNNIMYSDIIGDKEEEDMGGAKNLMALSNKKQGTNQKKSTKHPKPPTRGKGKFEFFFFKSDNARRHLRKKTKKKHMSIYFFWLVV